MGRTDVDEKMLIRSFRTTPELWEAAKERAAVGGDNLSEVLRDALERYTTGTDPTFTVVGDPGLPVADDSAMAWDGPAAVGRVFDQFTDPDGIVDETEVARAFIIRDDGADPQTKAAYKLPFADIIDGVLTIVPAGVVAAAGALSGARGGVDVPDEERKAAETQACALYDAVRKVHTDFPDCPLTDSAAAEHSAGCTNCGTSSSSTPTSQAASTGNGQESAIIGSGQLSESEDPTTQAAIVRVEELLTEGAVGVSIATDLNPDDMPDPDVIDQLIAEERWDELDTLMAGVTIRPRHVAIVDTPAFSDARLTLNDDGTVSGPVAFEGRWTGDVRRLPYGSLTWDENLLPIPIIWDRDDGDHTGVTVGFIDTLERQDGVTSAMSGPVVETADVEAVTAAAGFTALPARLFAKFTATEATPLQVSAPDTNGLRRVWGHAAPKGVCHRSDMGACFQYPGDVDPQHRGFHTGALVSLDDGTSVRVGALTAGGLHVDTGLARRGVGVREVNRHREDTNTVFAMVRAWEDPFGLAISGVLAADVTPAELLKVLATAPSVELWPSGRGRTLVGIHMVPTPAWPVAASAGGSAIEFSTASPITVEDSEALAHQSETAADGLQVAGLVESLARVEKALALLVADKIADIPDPDLAPVT